MFNSTIDSVIADIASKVNQLGDLADKHHFNAQNHLDLVEHHTQQAGIEKDNRDRALRIAQKFEELLS